MSQETPFYLLLCDVSLAFSFPFLAEIEEIDIPVSSPSNNWRLHGGDVNFNETSLTNVDFDFVDNAPSNNPPRPGVCMYPYLIIVWEEGFSLGKPSRLDTKG